MNTKKCCACKEILSLDKFNFNRSRKDGKDHKCKICRSKYLSAWHKKDRIKNRAHIRRWNKKRLLELSNVVDDYLNKNHCVDCGESNRIVLEFDHVRGIKCFNISNARNILCSTKKLFLEIEKCEVRCANCHRIVTHNRRHIYKVNY